MKVFEKILRVIECGLRVLFGCEVTVEREFLLCFFGLMGFRLIYEYFYEKAFLNSRGLYKFLVLVFIFLVITFEINIRY